LGHGDADAQFLAFGMEFEVVAGHGERGTEGKIGQRWTRKRGVSQVV
jgi:hypothetical protein